MQAACRFRRILHTGITSRFYKTRYGFTLLVYKPYRNRESNLLIASFIF